MTLSPSAASRRAMASPMPRFPPVTSTQRPIVASPSAHWGTAEPPAQRVLRRRAGDAATEPGTADE